MNPNYLIAIFHRLLSLNRWYTWYHLSRVHTFCYGLQKCLLFQKRKAKMNSNIVIFLPLQMLSLNLWYTWHHLSRVYTPTGLLSLSSLFPKIPACARGQTNYFTVAMWKRYPPSLDIQTFTHCSFESFKNCKVLMNIIFNLDFLSYNNIS